MKNNFIHTVLRLAARIFAVLCMRFRFLPPYMAGSESERLLQISLNDIINQLFWHRRKPVGFPDDKINLQTSGTQRRSAIASEHIMRELTDFICQINSIILLI
jgi:hypothetical protein